MLLDFGIDRVRNHGGDLERTSIVWLFQNNDKIFKEFSNEINKIIATEKKNWSQWIKQSIYWNMYSIWLFIIHIKNIMW